MQAGPLVYLHTLLRLRPSQIAWRLWYRMQKTLRAYRVPAIPHPTPAFSRETLRALRAFSEACNRAGIHEGAPIHDLRNQCFHFLNMPPPRVGVIPWKDADLSRLWLYLLHGFGYARDVAINHLSDTNLGDRDRVLHWMRDWIRRNRPGGDVAWDAYPVSERLLHWAAAAAAFELHEPDIAASYTVQALWLSRRPEYDVRANHLLKNAAALTVAGTLLGMAPLRDMGLRLLEREVAEQVLPDGGHYERSPTYHARVLYDLLVTRAVMEPPPAWLTDTARRMAQFLERILAPDGDIPLFGDAVLNDRPAPRSMLRLSRLVLDPWAPSPTFVSGLHVLDDAERKTRIVAKTVPPSPSYQPGHAHADMLSFELYRGACRIIVDSGVHGYAESPLRAYCRSTRAHNTVQVNQLEQFEAWGVFRVGRRSRAFPATLENTDEHSVLRGAYRHYTGAFHHERIMTLCRRTGALTVEDAIQGSGPLHVQSFLHLHPDCIPTRREAGIEVVYSKGSLLIRPRGTISTDILSGAERPTQGWYCPEFGIALSAPVLVLHASGTDTVRCGFSVEFAS